MRGDTVKIFNYAVPASQGLLSSGLYLVSNISESDLLFLVITAVSANQRCADPVLSTPNN